MERGRISRAETKYGVPKVFDGKNFVSQNWGKDHDAAHNWNYSPWLAIYAAAGSFAVLGRSTLAARLPFALVGLLALLLAHRLFLRWSASRVVADLALWLNLLCVPYLVHARQCRYYMFAVFFAVYLLYAFERWLEEDNFPVWHLAAASGGLFYSNFLLFFPLAAALGLRVLWRRRSLRRRWSNLAWALVPLIPGCLFFHVFTRVSGDSSTLWDRWENLLYYLGAIDFHLFPLLACAIMPLARRRFAVLARPAFYLTVGLAVLCLAPHHFFRYLLIFIPLIGLVTAELLCAVYGRSRLAAVVLAGLLLFTHLPSVSFARGRRPVWRADLPDFLRELTRPFREPLKTTVDFLNREAKPGDVLLVTYPDLPFMFYTSLTVIGGGSGTRAVDLRRVRWVLLREEGEKVYWPVDFSRCRPVPLRGPDLPWGNTPDPDRHRYLSVPSPRSPLLCRFWAEGPINNW